MATVRLLYVSTYDISLVDEIGNILDKSEQNNSRDGISGILCLNRKYFLQCLEGPRALVTKAFERILQDKRHYACELFECREVDAHVFPHWSMGYVGNTSDAQAVIAKHNLAADFNPYDMTAGQLLALLQDLSQNLESKTRGASS